MKLTVEKALKKLTIAHGIKIHNKCPVYYAWSNKKPEISDTGKPLTNFFIVDIDKQKSEWYVSYVTTNVDVFYGTIDDITGDISISKKITNYKKNSNG